jgi:phenylacetate-CoA ligase
MNTLFEKIYQFCPNFLQNAAITAFNFSYYKRRGGCYKQKKEFHRKLYYSSREENERIQNERLRELIAYTNAHSPFYRDLWKGIDLSSIKTPKDLRILPIVTKEDIRANFSKIATVSRKKSYVAHTGGTTGKSLEIFYTWPDFQERQAVLDFFREQHGWKLGKKTAWFSGKTLLTKRDEANSRFWKTDFWFNIRYYSTFHMSNKNLPHYIHDLNSWNPEFFSGFPSNIFEIADYARRNNMAITCHPRAIFTTAETLVPEQTEVIEEQFHSRVYDQYSSSEGAPFIIECEQGKYHLLPATGIIEILDEQGKMTTEGNVVITYFQSHGTPLVRYRLGDRMRILDDLGSACGCASVSPIVDKIEGRAIDFLYSKERGKINLGNISNCVKYTPGIVKFQVVQKEIDKILAMIVVDPAKYSEQEKNIFAHELKNRLGNNITIEISCVSEIPREPSGKYRIVINSLSAKELLSRN